MPTAVPYHTVPHIIPGSWSEYPKLKTRSEEDGITQQYFYFYFPFFPFFPLFTQLLN